MSDVRSAACGGLRQRHRQQSVLEIRGHTIHVNRFGQHERTLKPAVAALDAMKLFARDGAMGALAANDNAAFFGVDVDVVA